MPIVDPHIQPPQVESEIIPGSVPASDPNEMELNVGRDTTNDNFTILYEEKEDDILSISGIIAISCALAALIALFFYYEARRRNRVRINAMSRFNNGHKSLDENGVINVETSSGSGTFNSFGSTASSSIEEIKAAINNANWDRVYKLASQIAESNSGLSISGSDLFKGQNRSHLGEEDQERTKTLDDLATNGDWTGLAVTAALYAGETSGTSDKYSESLLSSRIEVPSNNQDVEEGQHSMETMVTSLSKALNAGNWSQVTKYANLIKNEKNSANSYNTDSQVLLTSTNTSSLFSIETSKTEMSKKQTIAKLIRAGKWKGVSIMANMYEIESKQGQPSSSLRQSPVSPTHLYSDTRSIKELRHSDRVEENIVGFRSDP